MVIFLNKVDLLKGKNRHVVVSVARGLTRIMYIVAKLKAKVRFANYVISYGNRPNDYSSITSCTSQPYFEVFHLIFPVLARPQTEVRYDYVWDCKGKRSLTELIANIYKHHHKGEKKILYCHLTMMTVRRLSTVYMQVTNFVFSGHSIHTKYSYEWYVKQIH
jgi:hypothetical protein